MVSIPVFWMQPDVWARKCIYFARVFLGVSKSKCGYEFLSWLVKTVFRCKDLFRFRRKKLLYQGLGLAPGSDTCTGFFIFPIIFDSCALSVVRDKVVRAGQGSMLSRRKFS